MTPITGTQNRTVVAPARQQDVATALDQRRPWLNVDLKDRLVTTDASSAQPDIAFMEITTESFRMATIGPLPVGAIFVTDLTLDDGRHQQVRARVTLSQEQRDGSGYVSRLEFCD